jgi:CRISPR/Cas system-associated endonuclease Cas3-HD
MEYDEDLIKVENLTLKRINSGKFHNEFPELYVLQKIIEYNFRNKKESVFNHTLNTSYILEQIEKKSPIAVIQYLDEKIDENTNRDILHIASYFKDIGKNYTLIKSKSGTRFPEYERVGSEIVGTILDKIYLSDLEKRITARIIENQNHLSNIVHKKNIYLDTQYTNLEDKFEIILELNMLALADTLTNISLKIQKPDEYYFRINFYKNKIIQF